MESIKKVFAVLFGFAFLGIAPVVFAGNSAIFDQWLDPDKPKVIGIYSSCGSYLRTHETCSSYRNYTDLRFNERREIK
jgi:hypothetical protein